MQEKTFISIEFWQIVGFLLSFLGVCFTFGKMLLSQFKSQLEEKNKQIEKLTEKIELLAHKQANYDATLPLNYVRREDYIRNQTVIEAKLDSVQETLTNLYKIESTKR